MFNAGADTALAESLLARLHAALRRHPEAHALVLLLGTNDILAHLHPLPHHLLKLQVCSVLVLVKLLLLTTGQYEDAHGGAAAVGQVVHHRTWRTCSFAAVPEATAAVICSCHAAKPSPV